MTLTDVQATWKLSGRTDLTGTNTSGKASLGVPGGYTTFSDATILYSFTVTATGANDVATLTASSGAVAQTTGTPSVTRQGSEIDNLAGTDHEGIALPTMSFGYGIVVDPGSGNGYVVEVASSDGMNPTQALTTGMKMPLMTRFSSSGTIAFSFGLIGDSVTVTILGK